MNAEVRWKKHESKVADKEMKDKGVYRKKENWQ